MSSSRLALIVLLLSIAALALPAGAGAAGLQTYVSGTGDDADDCTLLLPCKTWAGAISKTTAGGTISALDSAGFGSVTITKSVTLDGAGHLASSLAASTQGIIVNGAGISVVIKRLNIDATGICTPAATPHGIRFLQGSSLTVQDVGIQGFRGAGISLEPSDGHGTVLIRDSVITNNCTAGVQASSPALSGDMTVRVEDNLLTGNATGVRAGAHSAVTLTANTIVANTTPTATEAGGTLASLGDNRISGVTGTLGSMPAAVGPAPGSSPGPGAAPTPAPVVLPPVTTSKPVTRCKVPKLSGLTLASAKKALERAHCKLGTVSYRTKKGAKRNRVYSQSHKAGSLRVANAKVAVSVNGKAPRKAKAKHKARAAAIIGPATRTWVTAGGDDANPCSRTAPCRTFARAVTLIAQNGIVNVVGDGDYGTVTIDHSLTINGLGASAAISVASGNAITVAAGAGEKVTLSNLDLSATTPCTAPGAGDGVVLQSGGALLIDNVTAHGFPGAGIALAPSANGTATIRGGALSDNCTAGLSVQRPGGALAAVADGVLITDNTVGIAAGDGSLIHLTGSDVSDNATGFTAAGTGQIQAWPANTLGPNTTPGFTPGTLPLS